MKLRCLLGHKWTITHYSWRHLDLAHLSGIAGCRAECTRCGKVFDDLPYGRMVDKAGKIVTGPVELDRSASSPEPADWAGAERVES